MQDYWYQGECPHPLPSQEVEEASGGSFFLVGRGRVTGGPFLGIQAGEPSGTGTRIVVCMEM
jgi:hypothetical protein